MRTFIWQLLVILFIPSLVYAGILYKDTKQDEPAVIILNDTGTPAEVGRFTDTGILQIDTLADKAGTGAPDASNGIKIGSNETLEEYDIGTFTLTSLSINGSYGISNTTSRYTKIGRDVFITQIFEVTGTTSTSFSVTYDKSSLPFNPENNTSCGTITRINAVEHIGSVSTFTTQVQLKVYNLSGSNANTGTYVTSWRYHTTE